MMNENTYQSLVRQLQNTVGGMLPTTDVHAIEAQVRNSLAQFDLDPREVTVRRDPNDPHLINFTITPHYPIEFIPVEVGPESFEKKLGDLWAEYSE